MGKIFRLGDGRADGPRAGDVKSGDDGPPPSPVQKSAKQRRTGLQPKPTYRQQAVAATARRPRAPTRTLAGSDVRDVTIVASGRFGFGILYLRFTLTAPNIGDIERQYLNQCIDDGFVSSISLLSIDWRRSFAHLRVSPASWPHRRERRGLRHMAAQGRARRLGRQCRPIAHRNRQRRVAQMGADRSGRRPRVRIGPWTQIGGSRAPGVRPPGGLNPSTDGSPDTGDHAGLHLGLGADLKPWETLRNVSTCLGYGRRRDGAKLRGR